MSPATPSTGLIVVLSAPSGAGKTTLAERLREEMPEVAFAVTFTTREPRGSEKNGRDYYFCDVPTFMQKIDRGEFVEWAEVHGHFYGSPRSVIDQALESGGTAMYVIDVQGGQAIKRSYPEAVLVFVLPPSLEELGRRLRLRNTDSEDTIERRLLGARREVERGLSTYDFVIVNEELSRAHDELRSILVAERCRRQRVDVSKLQLVSPGEPPLVLPLAGPKKP